MPRIVVLGGIAELAVIGGLIALGIVNSPVDASRDALIFRLENAQSDVSLTQAEQTVDYDEIQYTITAKPNLWEPLTQPAVAAAKPPDLAKALEGITISRNTVGQGPNIKIKIITPEDRAGQWIGIGGTVRGTQVKAIDGRRGSVTFSQQFQGKEYTYTLTR